MKSMRITAFVSALVLAGSAVLCTPSGITSGKLNVSAEGAETGDSAGYTIKLDSRSMYYQIYENGISKNWNAAEKIESVSGAENFVISSDLFDYRKENSETSYYHQYSTDEEKEMFCHLFRLESGSVCAPDARNIIVSDGIYEIEREAFQFSSALESVSFGDSLVKIEEQNLPADIVIRGHAGSLAEKYASDNSFSFEYTGDINNDSEINTADIVKMAAYMSGGTEFDSSEKLRADENMDGRVNIADYVMMKNEIINPKNSSLGASAEGALAVPDLKNLKRCTEAPRADGFIDFSSDSTAEILIETPDGNGAENTVFSPLSVYMALSMAAECADGKTRDELLAALSVNDIGELRDVNESLFRSLSFDDYNTYCKVANSVWLNNKWELDSRTLKTIADKYYAVSFSKDFSDPKVPSEISDWIYTNTSGKLRPMIEINSPESEILRIINTVTFKEKWKSEFSKPSPDKFNLRDGSVLECDFLHREQLYSTVKIGFAENFMKYAVGMQDNYQMNFILPDEGTDINDIVSDKSAMHDIYSDSIEYQDRGIRFAVPVFDISSKFSLIDASKRLGMIDAFNPYEGNFTNIIDYEKNNIEAAFISEITHEATVKIDEKGCEAAAYTLIGMSATGCLPPPSEDPVDFILDRPFFWYISDNYGTPLFSGIINNPAGK